MLCHRGRKLLPNHAYDKYSVSAHSDNTILPDIAREIKKHMSDASLKLILLQ